jgi:hypothetical protein
MKKEGQEKMGTEKSQTNRKAPKAGGGHADLDGQYGNIGISAVAAALPYAGKAKNPHHASTHEEDHRRSEHRTRSVLEV